MNAPRLRFDKVAIAFVDKVRAALLPHLPKGGILVFTVTAPIRKDSKTADALVALLGELLRSDSLNDEYRTAINGNDVRVRLYRAKGKRQVLGFAHNPGNTDAIFEAAIEDSSQ
jgi:hypothetical protein